MLKDSCITKAHPSTDSWKVQPLETMACRQLYKSKMLLQACWPLTFLLT